MRGTGCHHPCFEGGPIVQGPSGWPPASNLTLHEDGLAEWSFEQFEPLVRKNVKPDGTPTKAPISDVASFASVMTDSEVRALWALLRSLDPAPTGS